MRVCRAIVALMFLASSFSFTNAHEVRPAYLELKQTTIDTYQVTWKVPAMGDKLRMGLYARFPDTCELVSGPTGMFVNNAYIEHSAIREPDALVGSSISIDGLKTTLTDVLVRIERLDGSTQMTRLIPESPTMIVEASPGVQELMWTYLVLGIEHILLGIDHLLFVLALLLLVKGWKQLVGTITSFTLAHSITLALAALGFVHVPGPPVEATIALSIVFVAAEIVRSHQGHPGMTERAPWLIAFIFGLLHGFGFAGALSEIGLPQQAIPLALLFFNLGVEIGQLSFVTIMLLVLKLARQLPISAPSWSWRLAPYAIGSIAMYWVIERMSGF